MVALTVVFNIGRAEKSGFTFCTRAPHLPKMTATADKASMLARLTREQLLAILEHLPYATGVFDAEFRYVYYNPAGEIMSGIPLEQAVGKTPQEIAPPMVVERMLPLLEQVRDSREKAKAILDFDFGQGPI